ncbi:MAG: gliding motility-associated C-terminal domain-containing protein [Bacteroidetes bacterium]|nr:gliding motility-associated C-terminal domain-containing protein [Bacteroidota bacterium]
MDICLQKVKWLVLLITFSISFEKSIAQCNISITNLPDTILACKNSTIQLNPSLLVTGAVPYFLDTTWTPAVGLSNPNILNPLVSVGTTSTNYVLTVQAVTPTNLIPNGDFSLGDSIFSSDYIYGTGGPWGLLSSEAQYAIATNPFNTHINFASFGDHTTGTGNMMVVNGAAVANVNIWCQTINVNPNTFYDFSAWGATCVGSNPAILQFSINGILTGLPLALPLATGVWTQFNVTWFSGSNTSITICITDQATALSGNDFAIDDISFREICNVTDSVYINTVNLTPSIQTTNQFGCDEDTVNFYANHGAGNLPATYLWSFGDGGASNVKDTSHIYYTQGVYNIKLITELNGCKDSATAIVNTLHPLVAGFGVGDTFCVNEVVTIVDNSTTTGPVNFEVNWGDGTIDNNNSHIYTSSGNFTIKLIITDTIGCKDSVTQDVFILSAPFVTFSVSDSLLCIGEPLFFKDSMNTMTESFIWDFNDGLQLMNVHNPMHTFENGNTYTITLTGTNAKCAPSSYSKIVQVFDYPEVNLGADTMICPGITSSIVLANIINPNAIYTWSTGATSNAISVSEPGHYWVLATTPNSECSTTDSIWIKRDCFINIPNSFSPNGDGRNDYFLPRELLASGLQSFNMEIYNRWGENIFSANSMDGRGWDGKYNGVDQQLGVYVYVINVQFLNGLKKEFTGNVTLMR